MYSFVFAFFQTFFYQALKLGQKHVRVMTISLRKKYLPWEGLNPKQLSVVVAPQFLCQLLNECKKCQSDMFHLICISQLEGIRSRFSSKKTYELWIKFSFAHLGNAFLLKKNTHMCFFIDIPKATENFPITKKWAGEVTFTERFSAEISQISTLPLFFSGDLKHVLFAHLLLRMLYI